MKLAAFDVGTNAILMLAVEYSAGGQPRVLADMSRITRLGRGVDLTGHLDAASAALTLDTIVELASHARSLEVEKFIGVATSALRDASDGAHFIAAVKDRAGVELEIISGQREAALSHLAVIRGLDVDPASSLLIVDIGGGSTELIAAQPGKELSAVSLQIGSVRLTERIVKSDPPSAVDSAELRTTIDAALAATPWRFRPDAMVGIAGTVCTICAVARGIPMLEPGVTQGMILSRTEVEQTLAKFGNVALEARRRIVGVTEGRADVIYAGAMILERVMSYFDIAKLTVSDQGVRWGLMWQAIER